MLAFLIISLFVLMIIGLPVSLAIGIPSLLYIIMEPSIPSFTAIQRMVSGPNTYSLLAIPFFVFAGNLMNTGGVTTRIFNFCESIVGSVKRRLRACERSG